MISIKNSEKYEWGNLCIGWHLVKNEHLSIIQEKMPAGTAEQRHRHHVSQQFFYVVNGEATFLMDSKTFILTKSEGIHVPANTIHQIKNQSGKDLEFLVISTPPSHGDRENF